jgi:hypothetical protein
MTIPGIAPGRRIAAQLRWDHGGSAIQLSSLGALFSNGEGQEQPLRGAGLAVRIPLLSRNHLVPTTDASPTTAAVSSLDTPCAIAFQRPGRSSRRQPGGLPGDRISGLPVAAETRPC